MPSPMVSQQYRHQTRTAQYNMKTPSDQQRRQRPTYSSTTASSIHGSIASQTTSSEKRRPLLNKFVMSKERSPISEQEDIRKASKRKSKPKSKSRLNMSPVRNRDRRRSDTKQKEKGSLLAHADDWTVVSNKGFQVDPFQQQQGFSNVKCPPVHAPLTTDSDLIHHVPLVTPCNDDSTQDNVFFPSDAMENAPQQQTVQDFDSFHKFDTMDESTVGTGISRKHLLRDRANAFLEYASSVEKQYKQSVTKNTSPVKMLIRGKKKNRSRSSKGNNGDSSGSSSSSNSGSNSSDLGEQRVSNRMKKYEPLDKSQMIGNDLSPIAKSNTKKFLQKENDITIRKKLYSNEGKKYGQYTLSNESMSKEQYMKSQKVMDAMSDGSSRFLTSGILSIPSESQSSEMSTNEVKRGRSFTRKQTSTEEQAGNINNKSIQLPYSTQKSKPSPPFSNSKKHSQLPSSTQKSKPPLHSSSSSVQQKTNSHNYANYSELIEQRRKEGNESHDFMSPLMNKGKFECDSETPRRHFQRGLDTSHDMMSPLVLQTSEAHHIDKSMISRSSQDGEKEGTQANEISVKSTSVQNTSCTLSDQVRQYRNGNAFFNVSWDQPSPIKPAGSFAIFDDSQMDDYLLRRSNRKVESADSKQEEVKGATNKSISIHSKPANDNDPEEYSNKKEEGDDFLKIVAAIVIQTFFRRHLAYKKTMVRYAAVLTIQNFLHGILERKRSRKRALQQAAFQFYDLAAVQIQKTWRGWWVRDCINVESYCATSIQRVFRSYIARKKYEACIRQIVFLQRATRSFLHNREKKCMHKAASDIQSRWRAYSTRNTYHKTVDSIITIQRFTRERIEVKRQQRLHILRSALQRSEPHTDRNLMNNAPSSQSLRTVKAGWKNRKSKHYIKSYDTDKKGRKLKTLNLNSGDLIRKWKERKLASQRMAEI